MIELFLPYPPSANSYWRHVGRKVLISEQGRAYRTAVQATCLEQLRLAPVPLRGRVSVEVTAYPPDKRRRDLDNLQKALFDSLTHAGLWLDDSQIDRILIQRGNVETGGGLHLKISEEEKP
jgi:crossover junction endodeoxyribonuclease RusA